MPDPAPPGGKPKELRLLHWRFLPTNEEKAAYWSGQSRAATDSGWEADAENAYYRAKYYERLAKQQPKKEAAARKSIREGHAPPPPDEAELKRAAYAEKVERKYLKHLAREQQKRAARDKEG